MAALLESQKLPNNIFKNLIESSTPIRFVPKHSSTGSKMKSSYTTLECLIGLLKMVK